MGAIWVLTGSKTGDNAQVLRAAAAMGLPYAVKRVVVRTGHEAAKPRVSASLYHVDLVASDGFEPPWPDLVITIGRRLSSVALWIRRQSGAKTRIALFNAPKGASEDFDLIVVPDFYRVAESARLCRIGLPLIAVDPARLAAAATRFESLLGAMAKPLHVLLLGGDMGTARLDPAFATDILVRMREGFASAGSIFVSTSRRTPAEVADAVARNLRPRDRIYRWSAAEDGNPYLGLLAHGDSFTVTADSLSMLTEVARLGKPLVIAEPPPRRDLLGPVKSLFGLKPARDLGRAANYLIGGGYAVRLGDTPQTPPAPPPDDTVRVAERLRQLVLTSD